MRIQLFAVSIAIASLSANSALALDDVGLLKQELEILKRDYERRVQTLENRLEETDAKVEKVEKNPSVQVSRVASQSKSNSFNPAVSLILDGRYAAFDNNPSQYKLPGFTLGGEAGLGEKGISLGHSELIISANIDDKFYGQSTLAIGGHEGGTEVELEEAFIQTLGLGHGVTIKAGRFFSAIGYLNEQHEHVWDFVDAPLVYRGLFGNQLRDDGLQINYIAPTDKFFQLGAEALSGKKISAGDNRNGIVSWTAFANVGDDFGLEHSWLLGVSHWQAKDIDGRVGEAHEHGGEEEEIPSFSGKSKISALDLVYKWAPNGNPKSQNFKFQFEYFDRREEGSVTLLNSDPLELTSYDGHQKGWYAQAIYQFMPQWRTGLRYDWLNSNNSGSDDELLAEAGLDNESHTPKRYSAMLEWLPSEFSRIRLQFNRDESYKNTDNQVFLQYTHSLGSHGAHQF